MVFNSKVLSRWLKSMLFIAVGAVVVVFSLYFINFSGSLSHDQERWAAFGDFVGGTLGSILSFFGFIALLFTIHIQSKELAATREELERSATAQEKTVASLKKQSNILSRQQFEQTFFSLLEQHNFSLSEILTTSSGRLGEPTKLESIRNFIFSSATLKEAKENLEQKNALCGHYFRILYQLLKFLAVNIPNSEVGADFDKDKIIDSPLAENEKMYSNIVRSFIGYDISQILAVNCYCEGEKSTYWRYKLLLERYEFLEHMPFEVDQNNNKILLEAIDYYEAAFGDSVFKRNLISNLE